MTEAHVPPKGCGNSRGQHQRAQWMQGNDGARHSSWKPGGLSVYGLCEECNHATSRKADPAYIDFHRSISGTLRPSVQRLISASKDLPVPVAPGLVARSVLAGMFAINSGLRERAPDLADGLCRNVQDLRLPPSLQLRLALTNDSVTRIGGPVGYMRVDRNRTFHMPIAEVWFPPLAWCLRSTEVSDHSLGPALSADWSDVSDWVRYNEDLTTDLRNVASSVPMARLPRFGAEAWVLLTGDEVMSALDGRLLQ